MGLRGEHLVTLLNRYFKQHERAGAWRCRRFLAIVFTRTFIRHILLILLTSGVVPLLFSLIMVLTLTDSFASPPLFSTSFTEPLNEENWQGDLSFFRTESGQDPGMLRLDAPPDIGTAYIATRNPYHAVHWEWYIRQNFTPSNNNRAFIYLNAETGILDDQTSGLAVRTGENGTPKHFRLFHFGKGGASTELLKSDTRIEADTGYRIRVLLTPDDELHLYLAEGRHNTPLLQPEKASIPEISEMPHGHFGFRTRYTATRSDQFYFSDVWIAKNLPEPDITDVSTSSPSDPHYPDDTPWQQQTQGTVITLTFSIPPDSTDLAPGLFQLDNGLHPDEIHCGHPQICSLLFRTPLSSGEHRLLTSAYNTIYEQRSEPEEAVILVAGQANAGDVIINEFMYRPPAELASYVELVNTSKKLLNLRNWRLQRRALASEPERFISGNDLFLRPGEFLVLTDDASALKRMPDAINIHEMSNLPRFNIASTDEIRLFSDGHNLIDSLQYQPSSWGGFEVALERKSSDVPAWIPLNWAESLSEYGGTPGRPNSVRPPDTPPVLLNIDYSSSTAISLTFSRMLDASSATDPDNIILLAMDEAHFKTRESDLSLLRNTGREISLTAVLTRAETITLMPSNPLDHGTRYLVRLDGIRDLFGNEIEPTETDFLYYDISEAAMNDVIINEVLYRPDQSHNRRFVEILNRSNRVYDLRGWRVGRSIGSPVSLTDPEISDPVFLTPGEKIVLSEPGLMLAEPGITNDIVHIELSGFPSLSRFGDSVYLLSAQDVTTDSLSYLPNWGGNRDGVSIERRDPDGATSDPSNWSEHPDSHTAGLRNFHFEDEPEPVVILFASKKNDREIDLHFSRFVRSESLQLVSLDDDRLSLALPDGTPKYASRFTFRSGDVIQRRFKKVHIPSVIDYAGNASTHLEIPLSFPPEPGEIIINEVMYQPIAERYSSRPDQSEYIEIFNRSGLHLHIDNLILHDRPDKNGHVRNLIPENPDLVSLPPERYAVFYADTSTLQHDTRLFRAFSIPESAGGYFLRINRQTLGLSTQGDELYLSDGLHILDSLWYHPSWHNPNISDVRGISLERISHDVITQNRTNWTSSSSHEGGTPGFINSATAPVAEDIHHGLKLAPNPFSPNGDGHNDHLLIHYQLDEPDYLMHVRVFDRQGRLVRTLADGLQAGRSGKLVWDGRTDRGLMNRAGLYIIHFEAFSSKNNNRKAWRAVAVLAVPL